MPPAFTDVRGTLPLSPYFRGANPNSRRAISWNSFERLGNVAAVTVFLIGLPKRSYQTD